MKSKNNLSRAKSINDILKLKLPTFPFTGKWYDAFGNPERLGVWIIWGNSGNGKSSFVMQMCKELANYSDIYYNSLEEGCSLTVQESLVRHGMSDVNGRVYFINDTMEQLNERLLMKRSPKIVIIDSFQYTMMNYKQYVDFKEAHKDKLLIFISHADGKFPSGRSAKSVMYDATLKIWVEGHRAFSKGRFIGPTGSYTIWEEGASRYWGDNF